jgi:outer membrane lipoprotein-sorting protein
MKYCVSLNKRTTVFLVFLVTFIPSLTFAQGALDSLRNQLSIGKVFQASVKHEFFDSYTQEIQRTVGMIWIYKSGYRLEADSRIIVVSDSVSRVYHKEKNQLIISPYSPDDDDFAPSRFIEASDDETMWEITEEKKSTAETQLLLVSEDDFAAFTKIKILLNAEFGPILVETTDSALNQNKTTFTNTVWALFSDQITQIEYPESTEIIDLR